MTNADPAVAPVPVRGCIPNTVAIGAVVSHFLAGVAKLPTFFPNVATVTGSPCVTQVAPLLLNLAAVAAHFAIRLRRRSRRQCSSSDKT